MNLCILLLILDSVEVYCLHVQTPHPCVFCKTRARGGRCTSLAHLLSKATKQNLSLCTRFHLKTKPYTTLNSDLPTHSAWWMPCASIMCSLRRGIKIAPSVRGVWASTQETARQDFAAQLLGEVLWAAGNRRSRGLMGLREQARQDLGTTQEVINLLA